MEPFCVNSFYATIEENQFIKLRQQNNLNAENILLREIWRDEKSYIK
jgi:hypothetical protein